MLRSLLDWLKSVLFGHRPRQAERQQPPRPAAPTPVAPAPLPAPLPPPPPTIYAAKAFDCAAARSEALAFLGSGLSTEQEGLVFAEAGAQAVAAGAGSGKSSTLVKRLLFMRHRLNVPLDDLTVFTFTRNSRQDFMEKLLEAAAALQVSLTPKQVEARVKTFHAKLLQLAAPVLPEGTQIFEFLGKAPKPTPGSEQEAAFRQKLEELADEEDNPYSNDSSAEQDSILRAVYNELYGGDERFKDAVHALLKHAYRDYPDEGARDEEDWNRRDTAAWRDAEFTRWVEAHWQQQGLWPVRGVASAPRALTAGDYTFIAHGYVPVADVFVVLSGRNLSTDQVTLNDRRFKPRYAASSKRRILLRGCSEAVFFVQTPEDIERLKELVSAATTTLAGRAPTFECRLPGEGGSRKPVVEALYELGVFVENIGLQPSGIFESLQATVHDALGRNVLYAVSSLFRELQVYKQDNGIRTFNDLFFLLRKGSPALDAIPLPQLRSMKHLLIDEFQDISPLIVAMIEGVHTELLRRSGGRERPTLLVVGDDWQSIYGWRGSAPRFFLEFSRLFSGASARPVLLESNYRSTQNIVSCASQVLEPISLEFKMPKNCKAANMQFKDLPYPVYIVQELDAELLEQALGALASLREDDDEILIVARTGKFKKMADTACKNLRLDKVRAMTVHGSKGLQAEYVLVLEDFYYRGSNPTKNALYALAGFPQSFDASQRDESLRVAYVALTRAKKLCVWMGRPVDGGAMGTVPDGQKHSRRVDAALLLDELAALRGSTSKSNEVPV